MGDEGHGAIEPRQLEAYLRRRYPDAALTEVHPLGQETQEGLKAYGYGRPLQVTFTAAGATRTLVLRTMHPDPFGHDRRSDRAASLLLSLDSFNKVPRHVRALDLGVVDERGALLSSALGEPFLVTEYVDGELYAHDLRRLRDQGRAPESALARARALADYLAELHARKAEPELYRRALRDTVGSGEGIFGLCDSYPEDDPVATPARLQAIETAAVAWRWRLKRLRTRACRTHGDFHPFNILFRSDTDFSVLDCSRGGAGEPADDAACLSVNYLFFGLCNRGHFQGPERELWRAFWVRYLARTRDAELLLCAPPFFAWRLLVLASPVWYPDVEPESRDRLLRLGERLLAQGHFDPEHIDEALT